MAEKRNNVVLIGMPGVGKSTMGVVLAKQLGFQFVDADLLIQKQEGRLLAETEKCPGPGRCAAGGPDPAGSLQ